MIKKKEKEHAKIHGIIQALREFVKALVDMERKGEVERVGYGEIIGFGYTAKYGYRAKIGIERKDFSRPYRKFQSPKEKLKMGKESIEAINKGNTISVLAKLPFIKEEDLKVKIEGDKLKVVVSMEGDKIERNIPIEKYCIQKASFKNGVLEIELSK